MSLSCSRTMYTAGAQRSCWGASGSVGGRSACVRRVRVVRAVWRVVFIILYLSIDQQRVELDGPLKILDGQPLVDAMVSLTVGDGAEIDDAIADGPVVPG